MARPKDLPKKFAHGTRGCYVNGCRCDDCKKSNREAYHARQRMAKELAAEIVTPAVPSPQIWTAPNGEKKTRLYKRACPGVHGKPCAWGSHLRKDSKGGVCGRCRMKLNWNGLVSADRARAHIHALSKQGVGYKSVAESACVSISVMSKIRSGQKKQIRAQTEKRILEVDVTAKADSAYVSAAATHQIIRKLLKKGYTKTEIAKRLGSKAKVPALQLNSKLILVKNAYKVQKLWNTIMDEEEIAKEMKRFCTECGYSHSKKVRLQRLKNALPATTEVLKEVFHCYYGNGVNDERALFRDLHELGALKDGPTHVSSPWYL